MGRDRIRRVASSTAGLHTLSISKIQAIPVPIPNAGELSKMSDRFELMESLVTNQRIAIDMEAHRAESLRESVLRTAFSGALVLQDPTDEPASTLLERIAAQRSDVAIAAPRRTRKSKA